jgi:hypothetical protein
LKTQGNAETPEKMPAIMIYLNPSTIFFLMSSKKKVTITGNQGRTLLYLKYIFLKFSVLAKHIAR